jgi:glycosyltransferase 2 family protein
MIAGSFLKPVLSFMLRLIFSFGLLWLIFTRIDTKQVWEVTRTADISYLLIAFMIFFVIHIVLLSRWIIFLRALALRVRLWDAARFFLMGLFGNLFLPSAIGGDIIKIVGLCRSSSEKPKVIASVLLDRLSGFAAIVLVAAVAFVVGFQQIQDLSLLISIGSLATGSLLVALVLFYEPVYRRVCAIFVFWPKFRSRLMQMHYDIALMRGKKFHGIGAIAVSCCSQLLLAISFFLIAKALGQNIGVFYFVIFVPLMCVASAVPSIGGLGPREAGAAFLFAKVGVDPGIAVSLSLLNFFFMVIMGLIGGLWSVLTLPSRRVQHHSQNAAAVAGQT